MHGKFSKTLLDSAADSSSKGLDNRDWEAYRSWLNQVASSRARPRRDSDSLYSFSGYRDWVAKIRKEWIEPS
jgi:hypothetical protein